MAADSVKTAMNKVNAALDEQKVKNLDREVEGIIAATSRKDADAFVKQLL